MCSNSTSYGRKRTEPVSEFLPSFFPSLGNNAVANNAAGDRMISGSPKQSRSQAKTSQWHPMTHLVVVDQNGAFGERTIFLQCSKLLNSICNL